MSLSEMKTRTRQAIIWCGIIEGVKFGLAVFTGLFCEGFGIITCNVFWVVFSVILLVVVVLCNIVVFVLVLLIFIVGVVVLFILSFLTFGLSLIFIPCLPIIFLIWLPFLLLIPIPMVTIFFGLICSPFGVLFGIIPELIPNPAPLILLLPDPEEEEKVEEGKVDVVPGEENNQPHEEAGNQSSQPVGYEGESQDPLSISNPSIQRIVEVQSSSLPVSSTSDRVEVPAASASVRIEEGYIIPESHEPEDQHDIDDVVVKEDDGSQNIFSSSPVAEEQQNVISIDEEHNKTDPALVGDVEVGDDEVEILEYPNDTDTDSGDDQ